VKAVLFLQATDVATFDELSELEDKRRRRPGFSSNQLGVHKKVICVTYQQGALSQGRTSHNPQETEIDSASCETSPNRSENQL
jgi:hypothetical protein